MSDKYLAHHHAVEHVLQLSRHDHQTLDGFLYITQRPPYYLDQAVISYQLLCQHGVHRLLVLHRVFLLINQSIHQSINQSIPVPTRCSSTPRTSLGISPDQSINQSIRPSINLPINQTIHTLINQFINEFISTINISINKLIKLPLTMTSSTRKSAGILLRMSQAKSSITCCDDRPPPADCKYKHTSL